MKRIDYLKLGKKALPWLSTGIPHPGILKDAIEALKGATKPEQIHSTIDSLEGLIKPGTERKVPEELRAFEREFRWLKQGGQLN